MSKNEQQYLDLCNYVLANGDLKGDRTGTGTVSVFGYQMRFNMREGFPLLTTKHIDFEKVLGELLAFIAGETNANVIAEEYKFKTWKKWQKDDSGDLGPIYGKQWRDWDSVELYNMNGIHAVQFRGIDQLQNVIDEIKRNKNSRRLIVSAWNVADIDEMALPPCHLLFQFYVVNGKLSLQLYQRSADIFLGVPYNIASYSALLHMVAHLTDLEPFEFIHVLGDSHIYVNHLDQVKLQLTRTPRQLPKIVLNKAVTSIDDFNFEDVALHGYNPHPPIKGDVAI